MAKDTKLAHIEWITPKYEDRLALHVGNNVIEEAEWHAVIRGELYGCVRKRTNHSFGMNTHFETYRVSKDGIARRASGTDGGRPLHYEVMHEGKTVLLLGCNDGGEVPRRTPCTMCVAKKAAA